jgi:starch synthase
MFLMPSRYEPCGLNQLYSLKYGAVPIVRATGGLADTIVDATDAAIAAGTATGFRFNDYTVGALATALRRACDVYHSRPDVWRQIVTTGMKEDWSWAHSAHEYVDLYRRTLAVRRGASVVAGAAADGSAAQ